MKNEATWHPTKYVLDEASRLRANRAGSYVSAASTFNVELLAIQLGRAIDKHATGRLLDLGCGAAPLYLVYRTKATVITCADWPSSDHGLRHVDVSCDLNEPLPFSSGSFDTIIFTDVLEHLANPALAVSEIARVLAPGGCLIGTVPFMYWLHEQPHDNHRFTEHALKRLAVSNRLQVEELALFGSGPDVLFDVMLKLTTGLHRRVGSRVARLLTRFGLASHRRRGEKGVQEWRHMPLGYLFVFRRPEVN